MVEIDGGADLRAALLAFARADEAAAVAAWEKLPQAERTRITEAIHVKVSFNDRVRMAAAAKQSLQPARAYRDNQGRPLGPPPPPPVPLADRHAYAAAKAALENVAGRLTDALRSGAWRMTYLPPPATPGTKRVDVTVTEWADACISIKPETLQPGARPRPGYRRSVWMRENGGLTGSARFHEGAPFGGDVVQAGGVGHAVKQPARKGFTSTQEKAAEAKLLKLLAEPGLTDDKRAQVGWAEWESRVREEFPNMSGEAWKRIKKTAGAIYQELRQRGRKPNN